MGEHIFSRKPEHYYEVDIFGKTYPAKGKSKSSAISRAVGLYLSDDSNSDRFKYPKSFLRSQAKTRRPGTVRLKSTAEKTTNSSGSTKTPWITKPKPTVPYTTSGGYRVVSTPSGKNRAEHKVVMETVLGRKLRPKEAVHHINADRADNRPENLELWVRTHPSGARARDLICPHCGKSYLDLLPDLLSLSSKTGIYIVRIDTK